MRRYPSVKCAKTATASLMMVLLSVLSAGCATFRTISEAEPGSPKVFSGARLDITSIAGDEIAIRQFKATPPPYPLVDLPFSLLFDALIFPLTFSVATYEVIFGK